MLVKKKKKKGEESNLSGSEEEGEKLTESGVLSKWMLGDSHDGFRVWGLAMKTD